MKVNDLLFFYHSNCKVPGIVGIAKVVREAYPDFTALDPNHQYYDPRSSTEKPIWEMVDVQFFKKFNSIISLQQLKQLPSLTNLALIRKGNRLSVMPVSKSEWDDINDLAEADKKLWSQSLIWYIFWKWFLLFNDLCYQIFMLTR